MKLESALKNEYENKIKGEIQKELGLKSSMAVPRIEKIVINCGLGKAKTDSALIDDMLNDVMMITGQRPVVTKSRQSISNFKIREGMPIGIKVTLRGVRMWFFLEKLINIALPRVKDFRGISRKSFDGKGNYSLGLRDHTVFPEIDTTQITRSEGMQIIVNTTATEDDSARLLLEKLGLPFEADKTKNTNNK